MIINYDKILIDQLIYDGVYYRIIDSANSELKISYLLIFDNYFKHCEQTKTKPSNIVLGIYNLVYGETHLDLLGLYNESYNYEDINYNLSKGWLTMWFLSSFKSSNNIKLFLVLFSFNDQEAINKFIENLLVLSNPEQINRVMLVVKNTYPSVYDTFTNFYYSGHLFTTYSSPEDELTTENNTLFTMLDESILSDILAKVDHNQFQSFVLRLNYNYAWYLKLCRLKGVPPMKNYQLFFSFLMDSIFSKKAEHDLEKINQTIYNI